MTNENPHRTVAEAVQAEARKCGARTVILDSDLRRFLGRLPYFASTMPRAAP